ncbi:MAG: hypothetical protein K2W97_04250 [Chthoniobacterales bacterium]|nr:hypothetical protein [Chthoniobacterales bacterium]
MEPLYFNPLDFHNNFIGTNPLEPNGPTGIPIRTTLVTISGNLSCYDPSLYQSYTFFSYPFAPYSYNGPTTYFKSTLIGSNVHVNVLNNQGAGQTHVFNVDGIDVYENYSTQIFFSSQFSTFFSTYAASYQIDPVTFSVRFGTELRILYGSTSMATNVIALYENIYTEQIYWYDIQTGPYVADKTSSLLGSGLYQSLLVNTLPIPQPDGLTILGSSTFVSMLGSNVYSALLDTTNSVIIYQNEQISSYYSQSLSYQINIINLTAALNSVATDSGKDGNQNITITVFSWHWETSPNGWTGSQVTAFDGYTYEETVNSYLYFTYGGTIIYDTKDGLPTTEVQALLSIQNNNLANSQTFLNNAVTTLQSQVSLAGQIITSLASGMETLINNI